MSFKKEALQEAERKLKQYYINIYEIGRLNNKLPILHKRKEKIQRDIGNNNISLEYVIPAANYRADKVQNSFTGSQQEQAIDNAYKKLEYQIERTNKEISDVEHAILHLKYENTDIDYIIKNLSTQHQSFVEAKYKHQKSVTAISQDMFVSR